MSKIELKRSDFKVFWETRIRYYELDPQGIMHNANYLAFYDQAVVEYYREYDFDYEKEIEETNKDWHTVQVTVQYNKPLYFDDEIEVGLKIKEIGNSSMTWVMGMFLKGTGELASASEIVHVYTDIETKKPTKITDDLKAKLGVKKKMRKEKLLLLFVFLLGSSCSFFNNDKEEGVGVATLENMESTTTTVNTNELSWVDAELLLAQCIRDNNYELEDPKKPGDLRRILTPIFIQMTQAEQQELYSIIEKCAEENNIPLDARENATPEQQAAILDAELEVAQCLREKGLDVSDPTSETGLRDTLPPLVVTGVISAKDLRALVRECITENGYEVPEDLREENDP